MQKDPPAQPRCLIGGEHAIAGERVDGQFLACLEPHVGNAMFSQVSMDALSELHGSNYEGRWMALFERCGDVFRWDVSNSPLDVTAVSIPRFSGHLH